MLILMTAKNISGVFKAIQNLWVNIVFLNILFGLCIQNDVRTYFNCKIECPGGSVWNQAGIRCDWPQNTDRSLCKTV